MLQPFFFSYCSSLHAAKHPTEVCCDEKVINTPTKEINNYVSEISLSREINCFLDLIAF